MNPNEIITWSAPEYEEKERHIDWFWALGVIVVASSATSVIFGNYFFALLLIIGGLLLGFFAIKKPETINYELNQKGLQIQARLYPFKDLKSFWVQKEGKPILFIKTGRLIMPILTVPIDLNQANRIHDFLLAQEMPEEEMKEHVSEKILESLGF